jgi:hypothetical protein
MTEEEESFFVLLLDFAELEEHLLDLVDELVESSHSL